MDAIITFMLVLVISSAPATVVPGYESRAACEAAAREVVEQERKLGRYVTHLAYCIPGPTRKS